MFLASAACVLMTAAPSRAAGQRRLAVAGRRRQTAAAMAARPLAFFSGEEAVMVEAIVDRLIPADELGSGGKAAGCAVFIDRELAGPYGQAAGLICGRRSPPETPARVTKLRKPAGRYRQGLQALAEHVRSASVAGECRSCLRRSRTICSQAWKQERQI